MDRKKIIRLVAFFLIASLILTGLLNYTGLTFLTDENKIIFEINDTWNLSEGFIRISQGLNVYDSNITVENNLIAVYLEDYNLTNEIAYIDLIINENVVESEVINFELINESSEESINENNSTGDFFIQEDFGVLAVPTHSTPILNSTFGTNLTNENLTVYNQSTADLDNDRIKNIYNWYMNGSSITVLNMPFEGGSLNGTVGGVANGAKDYSLGNNGTTIGTLWYRNLGYDGMGTFKFDGVDDEIDIPYSSSFNFNKTGKFTVLTWIKTDKLVYSSGDNGDIISHYVGGTPNNRSWGLQIRNNVTRFIGCTDGSLASCQYATGTTIIGSNSGWYLVGGRWDGSQLDVFVNGEVDDSTPPSLNSLYPIDSSYSLEIARGRTTTQYFNGSIDEVMIFNRSLSNEQIRLIYRNMTKVLHSDETQTNEVWNATVTPNDGYTDGTTLWSNSLTINLGNVNPPTVNISLTSGSTRNYTNGSLTVSWTFSDIDGDSQQGNETQWWQRMSNGSVIKNTTFANNSVIQSANLTAGEIWNASVRVYDGTYWSSWSENSSIVISQINNIPTASTGIFPNPLNVNNNVYGYCNFSDADANNEGRGDYKWYRNGTILIEQGTLSQLMLVHFDNGSFFNTNTTDNEVPVNETGLTNFTGKYGKDVFISTGDRLMYSSTGNINKSSGTIMFWLQPDWNDSDEIYERPFFEDSSDNFYFYFEPNSNQLKVNISVNSSYTLMTNTSTLNGVLMDNRWIHVAVMWNQSNDLVQIYLNGSLYANNTQTVEWTDGNPAIGSNINIGTTSAGGKTANSLIDEFAIYDKPLRTEHISDIVNRSVPLFNNEKYLSKNEMIGSNLTFECRPYDGIDYGSSVNYTLSIPTNTLTNTYASLNKSIIGGDGVVQFLANWSSNSPLQATWLEINEGGVVTNTSEKEVGVYIDDLSYFDWVRDYRTNEIDDCYIDPINEGYILHSANLSFNFTASPDTDYVYVRKYIDNINLNKYDYLNFYVKTSTANVLQTRISLYNVSIDGDDTYCDYPTYPDITSTGWQKISFQMSNFATNCDLTNISLIKVTLNDINNADTFVGSALFDEIYASNSSGFTDAQVRFNYKPLNKLTAGSSVSLRIHVRDSTGYESATAWYNLSVDNDMPNVLNLSINNSYSNAYSDIRLSGVFNDTTTPDSFWFEINGSSGVYNTTGRPVGYYITTLDDPNWVYSSGRVKGTNITLSRIDTGYVTKGLNVSYKYSNNSGTDYFFLEHGIDPITPNNYQSMRYKIKADKPRFHQMRMDLWCEDERPPESYRTITRQNLIRTTEWQDMEFKPQEYFVDNINCTTNNSITRIKLEFNDFNNSDIGSGDILFDEMYFAKKDLPTSNVKQVPFIFEWTNFNETGNFTFRVWINDSTGNLNNTDWFTIIQKQFSDSTGNIAVDNGSIIDEVISWRDNTISDNYTSPSYEEKQRFKNLSLDLLSATNNGNINEALLQNVAGKASSFGLELVNFSDNITGYTFYLLRENTISKGWGGFIFNPSSASNYIIEAPHPIWDTNSTIASAEIFTEMFPKALVVSTTYRYTNRKHDSDAGHSEDMLFASVHDALIGNTSQPLVIHIHGFAASGLADTTWQAILSDAIGLVRTDEMNQLVSNISNEGYKTCVWNFNCSYLSATNDVCAHDTKRAGGQFIHVELNTSMRVYPSEREKVARAFSNFREWLPPNVTLTTPNNSITVNPGSINFNCNVSDSKNVTNVTFYLGTSTNFRMNGSIAFNTNQTNATFARSLTAGTYYWNCWAIDRNGNNKTLNNNYTLIVSSGNNAPTVTEVNVTSTSTQNYTNGTLITNWTYSDADGNPRAAFETKWYKLGVLNTTFVNNTNIQSGNLTRTDNWTFSVRASDGTDWSNWSSNISIILRNFVPLVNTMNLTSTNVNNYTNGSLYINWSMFDIDAADTQIMNETKWCKNGALNSTFTNVSWLNTGNFTAGENWSASVRVYDGGNWSEWSGNATIIIVQIPAAANWVNITTPEGVFAPYNSTFVGTQQSTFSIKFTNLSIETADILSCSIMLPNSSLMILSNTGLSKTNENYTLNYTLQLTDSIVKHSTAGYLPWIIKNCTLTRASVTEYYQNLTERIYTHDPIYWLDEEITRAVTCEGTPGVYFNNTGKCEFSEDTVFALQMRNGNPVNTTCFNNPGLACGDPYCNGIYFPSCDPLTYFSGYSADVDDPNGYATYTTSFAGYSVPVAYTYYTNSQGTFKLRVNQSLTGKTFSFTIYNLTDVNASETNIYGNKTGNGALSVTSETGGTFNVAYYNFSSFTGVLDFVMNISFTNKTLNTNRTLKLVIAFGTDTNQGDPTFFNATFNPNYGLNNNNESQNTSATADTGGVCGDEANNDFDYKNNIWENSYDCFDLDCNQTQGDESQTNEFGSSKTGLCNFNTESNCNDRFDNDYDYILGTDYTDCHDANCFNDNITCPVKELICDDGANNDWDYTLGETDLAASIKIGNNGTKYTTGYTSNITDCEDVDCNNKIGGGSGQLCNWGYESNCSDSFDNDDLQLKDCELNNVASTTTMISSAEGEYDCANYCRITNSSSETGNVCSNNIDDDWDAIVVTGYYSDQYSANSSINSGIDCRWGGYFGYGSDYNPDEDCNLTTLTNGFRCELARELNCTDSFDNDFDQNASSMPHANWGLDKTGYYSYFGKNYAEDGDYDDYDCNSGNAKPSSESINSSWCFDSIDNDLDKYYWNGSGWTANSSTGIDCYDNDCLGISNPSNANQSCLSREYNEGDTFFTNLSYPGLYCDNDLDDDVDINTDCDDTDCLMKFGICTLGPCYQYENITWNSCADSSNNDNANGTNCGDPDCVDMLGNTSGQLCESSESLCSDLFDNDNDGNVDCLDSNCVDRIGSKINNIDVYCRSSENSSYCVDGFDNDNDGNVDCLDSGCDSYCELSTISGTNSISLPQQNGQTSINSVSTAYILDYTNKVRKDEWYNITFKMTGPSSDAQWTLGTASGARFNKSAFNTSSEYLAGTNAASFTITETSNGFVIDSNGALGSGYTFSFLILANQTLSSSTYELTYSESTGSQTSLNNYIIHEVVENVIPAAQKIEISPNSTNLKNGESVYLRANISDNNALGLCDWYVYGNATFNPANSTTCVGSFTPTIEGIYYVNATPYDYYSNRGTDATKEYNLNILPSALSTETDERFYNQSSTMRINATFNKASSDTLGTCEVIAKNSSSETSLGTFSGSGSSCNGSIALSSLGDGEYSIFIRVTETTEGNTIEGSTKGIFVCSQANEGICSFTDFNSDNKADLCTEGPSITLNSPSANYSSSSGSTSFNCSAVDVTGLKNITLYVWSASSESVKNTTEIEGYSNSSAWSNSLGSGTYTWNCLAYDNSSNSNWGTNRTLNIAITSITGSVTGGGGGGGGGKIPRFEVYPEELEYEMVKHEAIKDLIRITSITDIEQEIKIKIKGLKKFITIEENRFILAAGESKSIELYIVSSEETGSFYGKIDIENKDIKKEIPIIIEVESVNLLFDAIIEIVEDSKKIYPGDILISKVAIMNAGAPRKVDVELRYYIKNDENKIIWGESDTRAIDMEKIFYKNITLPEDITPDSYILALDVIYEGTIATSSARFDVVEKKQAIEERTLEKLDINFYVLFAWGGLFLILFAIIILLNRKKKRG